MVLDDASVSRKHAEIRYDRDGWSVRDLASANGTFLNGKRLDPGTWPLRVHDIIRFGNVTVVVEQLRPEVRPLLWSDEPLRCTFCGSNTHQRERCPQMTFYELAIPSEVTPAKELRGAVVEIGPLVMTGTHCDRVAEYAALIAEELELPEEDKRWIQIGATLHDVGNIGIEDGILRKPGKLTPAEFEIMKTHTTKGAKILEGVPELGSVMPIIRSHHERWDDEGYPDGLKGERIPRLARIVHP